MTQEVFNATYYRQLSADNEMKNYKIKTGFVFLEGRRPWLTKTGINFKIIIFLLVKNFCNIMLYVIFQYD